MICVLVGAARDSILPVVARVFVSDFLHITDLLCSPNSPGRLGTGQERLERPLQAEQAEGTGDLCTEAYTFFNYPRTIGGGRRCTRQCW